MVGEMFDKRVITFTAFTGGRRTHTSSLIYVQREMMQAFLFFFSVAHSHTHTHKHKCTHIFFCFLFFVSNDLHSPVFHAFIFLCRALLLLLLFIYSSIYLFIYSFIHLFDDKSRLPYPYVKPTNVHHR